MSKKSKSPPSKVIKKNIMSPSEFKSMSINEIQQHISCYNHEIMKIRQQLSESSIMNSKTISLTSSVLTSSHTIISPPPPITSTASTLDAHNVTPSFNITNYNNSSNMNTLIEEKNRKKTKNYSKYPHKKFGHPQLEYTIAEIMNSPYLANPLNNYPIENNKLSLKIKELKKAGIKYHDLTEEEKPFNYKELMKRFNDEVCYYLPGHGVDKKTEEVNECVSE